MVVTVWQPADQWQTSTALTAPNWAAGPAPTTAGGTNQVTVRLTGRSPRQFYRLIRSVCNDSLPRPPLNDRHTRMDYSVRVFYLPAACARAKCLITAIFSRKIFSRMPPLEVSPP